MRAMKNSGIEWIGEIPQGWGIERLKYHALFNPQTILPDYSDEDQVTFIPMDSLKSGFHLNTVSNFGKVKKGYVSFAENDVLMAKVTPCLENGNLAIATNIINGVGFGSTEINVIRCHDIKTQYLFYLLQCPSYIEKATFSMFGVAGLKRLEPEFLPNSFFPIPSQEEQAKISDYLDAKCAEIDALIAAKEKTNALLKERRQSIIYEAVTKGLDPSVPMKDSGVEWIGEIPEGWLVAPLKFFASIRSGFTLGKKYGLSQKLQDYPYLRVANVQGEYTDLEIITTIQMPPEEAEQYKLKVGELLMTEGGDRDKLGRGSIWQGEIQNCLHQNHVFALSTDDRLNIKYLDYLTASDVGRNYFDYTAVKTTNLASTNATTILNFKIPIPGIDEQLEIVEYLKKSCQAIDEIIQINSETIQKLKEYRQSLIYEAVTGKIEV